MLEPSPEFTGVLPPPEQLKHKVLLKHKMISTTSGECEDEEDDDEEERVHIKVALISLEIDIVVRRHRFYHLGKFETSGDENQRKITQRC